ncbi:hypothetical protein BDW72DRAFT_174674 [Aspergillus terricola var. indicus]
MASRPSLTRYYSKQANHHSTTSIVTYHSSRKIQLGAVLEHSNLVSNLGSKYQAESGSGQGNLFCKLKTPII